MAEYSLLRNAPIAEALIDIRIKIREETSGEIFQELYERISERYPKKTVRRKQEGKVEFKKGELPVSTSISDMVLGYAFASADGKQIFQARIDGFTFSRLKPYDRWETFRDEASGLWEMYRGLTSPEILRVGLRYINKISIPLIDSIRFEDYFTAPPMVPKELPQGVSSFFSRVVMHDPEVDAVAIVMQVFEGILDPKFVPLIFDIDVSKQKEIIGEEEAWETLERLRNFKNRIFFAGITEKAKELFQ